MNVVETYTAKERNVRNMTFFMSTERGIQRSRCHAHDSLYSMHSTVLADVLKF